MRLKKLELFGFKSFPEKMSIEIGRGIMAVVGPNGCGKSNIVDAIRWGLGEQSARILRGESMGDVIFAGSKTRKPLGMAQVALTFSNDDGCLPVEFTEVSVSRRVFRSGESEYLLNRDPCRLKDIKDMFRGTGVGSHSYSLIERAQIDSVITDGTADRRLLLEEAAGITNYKARKREALRKLEATENDLIRLNDIITEIEREARSLGRQVGKAKRYHRYSSRIKGLDVSVSYRRHKSLMEDERALQDELAGRRSEEAGLHGRRGALDAGVETLRAELLQEGREVSELERNLRGAEGQVAGVKERTSVLSERRRGLEERATAAEREAVELKDQIESDSERKTKLEGERDDGQKRVEDRRELVIQKEEEFRLAEAALSEVRENLEKVKRPAIESVEMTAQLEAKVQRHRSELVEREAQIRRSNERKEELLVKGRSLNEELEAGRNELERLLEGLKECRSEEEARAAGTEGLWEEASALRETEKKLAERVAGMQSRLKLLKELQESYEGLGEGVMLVMKNEELRSRARIVGPLAGLLRVPDEHVPAVEGALGEALQHLVSEDLEATAEVLATRPSEAGTGVTVMARHSGVSPVSDDLRNRLRADDRVTEWLPSACDGRGEPDPIASAFLAGAFIVKNEAAAVSLAKENANDGLVFVTPNGFAVKSGASMLRTGGCTKTTGLICRAGEIETSQAELDKEALALNLIRDQRAEVDRSRTGSMESLEAMRQKVRSLQQACFDKEKEVSTARAQLESCEEELARVASRSAAIEAASKDTENETEQAHSLLREAEVRKGRCDQDLKEAEKRERALEADRTSAQTALHGALGLLAEAETAVRELNAEVGHLAESAEELGARRQAKTKESEEERKTSEVLAGELLSLEQGLDETRAEKTRLESSLGVVKEQFARSEEALEVKEKEAREARAKAQEATQKVHDTEIRLTQVSTEESGLKTRVLAEHGVDLDDYAPEQEEEIGVEDMQRELDELREKLGKLGAVNLLAVDDYKNTRDRLQFLTTQRDDLVKAREGLLEAIQKINVTASSLFMETFWKVRENFKKTFSTLFKGGEAELSLIGDDPLEAEVEIQARPGGKKLQSIKLLSGGERALTALSLLFAVYLVKPSPFCILDEVDAPLDDANVDKFIAMIHEFSARTQFIVVTHNKMTMEAADSLYGITMPEPGTSKLVSVKFDERGDLATLDAQPVAIVN